MSIDPDARGTPGGDPKTSIPPDVLRPSELAILYFFSHGYTKAEIAQRRTVSIETVKSQTKALMTRLGAHNQAHAVAIGFRTGLLE